MYTATATCIVLPFISRLKLKHVCRPTHLQFLSRKSHAVLSGVG